MSAQILSSICLIVGLGLIVSYHDVRYRRIPNKCVLTGLFGGLWLNAWLGGWHGTRESLAGCALAFGLMFVVRLYSGATGPGDIKLFAAIGAIIGWQATLPTFLIVLMTGGVLALLSTIWQGTLRVTLERVALILYGFMPGQEIPRFPVPADRKQAIPYGVAICMGSLISMMRHFPQLS